MAVSIVALTELDPGASHVRVRVFAGPDAEHRALLGVLVARRDEAAELVARLADPLEPPAAARAWGEHQSFPMETVLPVELRPPVEWEARYGRRIYDPDGWRHAVYDGQGPALEPRDFTDPISYDEFVRRAGPSTTAPLR